MSSAHSCVQGHRPNVIGMEATCLLVLSHLGQLDRETEGFEAAAKHYTC